ncbi:MAG: PAS domain-containing protein [Gaiellaceae bacterium]
MTVSDAAIQSTLLGDAIDSAPLAVFVADEAMRYVAVNQYACEMLGYSREELLALRITDVSAYAGAEHEYAEVVAHRRTGGVSTLRRSDGTELAFRYRTGETKVAGMTFYVAVGWPE